MGWSFRRLRRAGRSEGPFGVLIGLDLVADAAGSGVTIRRSFAKLSLEVGYGIRTIQDLIGHRDVLTTMIYAHVLNQGGRGIRRPLDAEP